MIQLRLKYWAVQEHVFFNWPKGIRYKHWRKGRRVGGTKGAAHAIIELMLTNKGYSVLWGDTVNGNIIKYFERYFKPLLDANDIKYTWSAEGKKLIIGESYCDFRSADLPENWEGFGYDLIFLNEAGIILKNETLYTQSVLPMLMDNPNSKLIAAGVPKGKKLKNGKEHSFYTLYKRAQEEPTRYMSYCTTSYDSPFTHKETVKQLEGEMFAIGGQSKVDQEIYAEFVDKDVQSPFIIHELKPHLADVRLDRAKQLFISIDFNLTPFGLIAAHIWFDRDGFHFHVVDELQIENGSIPKMIDEIKARYPNWLHTMIITGDKMGTKGELSERDNASYYDQIRRGLNLRFSQFDNPANPTHDNSKGDCNYVFYNHPDFRVNPLCENLCFDLQNVEIDSYGKIIKSNRKVKAQQADMLDCFRYMVNTFLTEWKQIHLKSTKNVSKLGNS